MAALVEIDQVARRDRDFRFIKQYYVEKPRPSSNHPAYSFDLEGWAVGRNSRFAGVELLLDDTRLWTLPAAVERPDVAAHFELEDDDHTIGFYGPVNCLRLPTEFECVLVAVVEDDSRMSIADITGRRAPLVSSFEPSLSPLMVTTLGRTGSSVFVSALDAHPEIVSYRPMEYEPRAIDYWMEAFLALAEPSSYLNQLDPPLNVEAERLWWLGEQRAAPRKTTYRIAEPDLANWMGGDNLGDLASIFQSRAEALYGQVATVQGKRPRYFAEKIVPNNTPTLVWELYPEVREVFLVRDFRDMVSSILAFNVKRGRRELLGLDLAVSDADYVLEQVRNGVLRLFNAWTRRGHRGHIVRYEELVSDPRGTLEALLDYLELDSSGRAITAMLKRMEGESQLGRAHRTTKSPQQSIGRWKTDLDPALQAVCNQQLGFALEAFGYPLQPAVPA